MNNKAITRFLGGSPFATLVELVLISILVGVLLASVGFDRWHIWRSLDRFIQAIWGLGFAAVAWLWRYCLLGAVIVIPIWLIIRLLGIGPTGRS